MDRASVDIEVANQPRYNRFKSGHPAGFTEAFANYYWDISDALVHYRKTGAQDGKNDFVFTVDSACEGLMMLEAMAQSAQENRWVRLALREGA